MDKETSVSVYGVFYVATPIRERLTLSTVIQRRHGLFHGRAGVK